LGAWRILSRPLHFINSERCRARNGDLVFAVTALDRVEQLLCVVTRAILEHELDVFYVGDACGRIAVHDDEIRLREALDRAAPLLSLQRGASLADRLEGLLAQHGGATAEPIAPPPAERFVVRDGERLSLLDVERIEWFESDGNYVRVHAAGRAYVMRTTMDRVVRRLAERHAFVRVRRSALINVRAIATLERYDKGTYVVQLRDGTKVISSRYYRPALRALLRSER
jgi:two-component system, LytTR family, response regulator